MPIKDWREAESQIAAALRKLTTEGADNNFAIISCGDAYVQYAGKRSSKELYCEAVGNEYLPKGRKLTPDRIDRLERLGFHLETDTTQFSRQCKLGDDAQARELARATLDILADVYDCPRDAELEIQLTLE